MFRMLAGGAGARAEFVAALCDPGPGLLVLDEAHRLKEQRSQLYKAMGRIRTRRRVLASGYPVQNRLDEYWALALGALAVLERLIDASNAAADSGAKLRYARIDGATPAAQRSAIVDDFSAAGAPTRRRQRQATEGHRGASGRPSRPAGGSGGRGRRSAR
ncbi:hypothetical protein JL720_16725 [Aureococcus anophagefferens]|nr:hypothetical protein JL720_16725 [Aureococcus anophagefferens]